MKLGKLMMFDLTGEVYLKYIKWINSDYKQDSPRKVTSQGR